jgi:hypothetical protein
VSEPADTPQPEPERYDWRSSADREVDVLALVVTGVIADYDAATSIIATLSHEQLVSALWITLRWYGSSLALQVDDPLAELQRIALILAKGRAA